LKADQQLSYSSAQNTIKAIYVWLRIVLSYCVIGAVITTLVSAYAQEVHLLLISMIMATFLSIGVYQAEITRHRTGLNNYLNKLAKHKHRQF
jgi:hypothetical protein